MGAIRSTAQLLSYELVFSSIILILILFSGSFSLTYIVECQQALWNIVPLLPLCLMFFIAILAETNRPPFDLSEAELGHLTYLLLFFKSFFKGIGINLLSKDHYMLETYIK
jgi:NADH:ubiquinone oxidoreductase subunit H